MKIYISGISGTGMGPLALMAKEAGLMVCGSDLARGAIYDELVKAGIDVKIGEQDGEFLKEKMKEGVDWFVHTSALPEGHAELVLAREAGIKCTKRDDLTAYLVDELSLKMVAVAGTHGKTTTTAMIVWASLKLKLPISYIVGTTLGFAPSGAYKPGSKYFIYEADEYDRNFLKYHPWLAVIPCVSYDHPDIYPSSDDYTRAFEQFESQSQKVLLNDNGHFRWVGLDSEVRYKATDFELAGEARRMDAALAAEAVSVMEQDMAAMRNEDTLHDTRDLIDILNQFPGVGRRFERISDGLYSDYAHHPEEIMATMDVAKDECRIRGLNGVVVIYQPHQNTRQHEVREGYKEAFVGAKKVLWLPTYLTRENPELEILTPEQLIDGLVNKDVAEVTELSDELAAQIQGYLNDGNLVVLMTAGPADGWLRDRFA